MKRTQIIYGIVIIALVLLLEYYVSLSYITKQMVRIPLLVLVPYFIMKYTHSPILQDIKPQRVSFHDLRISLIAGMIVFLGAIGGYALIYFISDPSAILTGLGGLGITANNIIYVGIYMTIFNAFVEEFFFRGFVYMSIKPNSEIRAYLISSFLFAIFHLGIVSVYFEPLLLISLLFGLMIVGAFLIYINRFGKGLLNSYIVHVFADIAMFSIGFYLFLQ